MGPCWSYTLNLKQDQPLACSNGEVVTEKIRQAKIIAVPPTYYNNTNVRRSYCAGHGNDTAKLTISSLNSFHKIHTLREHIQKCDKQPELHTV